MQYELTVDLASTKEWGLNMQQGVVFAYLYSCPSWCTPSKDHPGFFNISNGKLVTELSVLTEHRDTMLRYVMQLVKAGVIERKTISQKQYIRLTEKGQGWKRKRHEHREENPVAPSTGKNIPQHREENPVAPGKISDVSEQPDQNYQSSGFIPREREPSISDQLQARIERAAPTPLPDGVTREVLDTYVASRAERGKPIGRSAVPDLLRQVVTASTEAGIEPDEALRRMTVGGWNTAEARYFIDPETRRAANDGGGRRSPPESAREKAARFARERAEKALASPPTDPSVIEHESAEDEPVRLAATGAFR